MTRRQLLTVMAAIEWGAGLALLLVPAVAARWLFADAMPGLPMGLIRLCGLGLIGLGVMCWFARGHADASRPFRVMLGYNLSAALILPLIGLVMAPVGVLLWPAVAVHAGLTALQVREMRRRGA